MNLVPFLLDGARGAVILGASLAALPLARRAPARVRRALVLVALVAATCAPFATRASAMLGAGRAVELPFFVREILVDPAVDAVETPAVVARPAVRTAGVGGDVPPTRRASIVPWSTLLGAAWVLGAAAVIIRLAFGLRRARAFVRRARRDEAEALEAVTRDALRESGVRAEVAISDDVDAPAVTGIRKPIVLLPRAALDWSRERLRLVLLHELAHVARRDCLASLIAEIACAVHWFDPLSWMARRRLRRERELSADEDVLAAGVLATDYAGHLLAIAAASQLGHVPGALGMTAKPSDLAERIESLVRRDRAVSTSAALLPSIVGAASLMALVVACANPRPPPPPGTGAETASAKVAPATSASATPPAAGSSLLDEVAREMGLPASRIELTIDPALQRIADDEIAHLVDDHRPAAATAIILDPAKGELLAIHDVAMARRAFVTGSTLKTVTVAAALEAGTVRLDQKFDCRRRSFGAHTLEDAKDSGQLDIREILEVSSNVGASRLLDATGRDNFDATAARFHLGAASTVELPNMARGDVAKTASLDAYEAAVVAAGEGLAATPLQMATVYGVIANGGEYVASTLVRKTLDEAGRSVARPAPARERVVRAETARTVMQLLERAVQGDHATGKRAKVEGVRIAGKTGTAGFTTPDGQDHVYSSFIGVVPADAPRYVILVGAADPREGAAGPVVAAPTFARIAARVLSGR